MGSIFAIQHPSQPNYLHFFSGDRQGVADDNLPSNFSTTPTSTYPFNAPNLGAEILSAGFTFAGYSEQLEAAGAADWADYDPHTASDPTIFYRRRHNPWANWVAKVSPIPANQLPSSANKAFISFPTDYSTLPTVSIIVPNLANDMHNGSRRQGDDWLRANLDAYANWAKTNNSLLIVTWDEDDYNNVNQIPTVFYGAGLRNGTTTGGTWTLHNLLRTIEDMYGIGHAGAAAQVRPIVGPFTTDPPVTVVTLRQGLAGYSGAQDTQLWAETPSVNYGATENLTVDLDTSTTLAGNQVGQALVRFGVIFGTNANQVPTNAIIQSAKLIVFTPLSPTGASYESGDTFRLHRMLTAWDDTATWDSFVNGVSTDDVEAASTATFSVIPVVDGAPAIFDVTSDIELFKNGTPNRGWLIRPSTTGTGDGWTFKSSEAVTNAQRPALEIVYNLPVSAYQIWANGWGLVGSLSQPAADPDRDGASNLTEFAYNMNPTRKDVNHLAPGGTTGLPAARYLPDAGGILEIEFLHRKGPTAAGLTYAAHFSDSVTGPWVPALDPAVTPINADWERVTVRSVPVGITPQQFGKVVVTLQQ